MYLVDNYWRYSEIFVILYHTTRCHISGDSTFYVYIEKASILEIICSAQRVSASDGRSP
jgi:hypothetical protein